MPYSTYLYLDFHLCSMTKLKENIAGKSVRPSPKLFLGTTILKVPLLHFKVHCFGLTSEFDLIEEEPGEFSASTWKPPIVDPPSRDPPTEKPLTGT